MDSRWFQVLWTFFKQMSNKWHPSHFVSYSTRRRSNQMNNKCVNKSLYAAPNRKLNCAHFFVWTVNNFDSRNQFEMISIEFKWIEILAMPNNISTQIEFRFNFPIKFFNFINSECLELVHSNERKSMRNSPFCCLHLLNDQKFSIWP